MILLCYMKFEVMGKEKEEGKGHPHSNFLVFLWLISSSQHGESLLTNALEENTV